MKVAVIGAGAAGTAAAWFCARARAEVTIVHDRAGATALYSGALDLEAWDEGHGTTGLDPEIIAFAAALGTWSLRPVGCRLVTNSGLVRPSRGLDHALLDLSPLAGRSVAVVEGDRDGWNGAVLARALSASSWANSTRTQFTSVKVQLLRENFERRISSYDFARLHDVPERGDWLSEQLRRASTAHDAWLLGPWLGVDSDIVDRVREVLQMPVGETTSLAGGPAGARFEHARDRLLEASNVRMQRARVRGIERNGDGWKVDILISSEASAPALEVDRVILAVGGVAAGGVRLHTLFGPDTGVGFTLSLNSPVGFVLDEEELADPSSMFGLDLAARGITALERVGISVQGTRVAGQSGLFAAGDCLPSRPRTVLSAVRSGIMSARALLGA